MEGAYVTSDDEATKLKATVQRLEQDNRRLRHLDAMPIGAIVSAMEWCDKTGADESIVNDIAVRLWTVPHDDANAAKLQFRFLTQR